jgi:hypothetical protein
MITSYNIVYTKKKQNLQNIASTNTKPNKHLYLKAIVAELDPLCETIEDYLYMANVYEAAQEKLYFKLKQIQRDEYGWLKPEVLKKCKKRLLEVLEKEIMMGEPEMEKTIVDCLNEQANKRITDCLSPYFQDNQQFQFTARVDLITEETLWELKCTSEISNDHKLQLVIYAWLWNMRVNSDGFQNTDEKIFKIYNIKTNELFTMNATIDELNYIVISILKGKYQKNKEKTLEEFLYDCEQAINTL